MVRLLTDEHIPPGLNQGIVARLPGLDIIRVHDVGLRTADDETILEWAGANGYVVVTYDRNTFPGFAYTRMAAGQAMPGLLVVDDHLPLGQAIDELAIVAYCTDEGELENRVVFLPLRPSG
ncbi:MAG: DUF5615 family PIN-like protein [Zavarzinella sp.]|nr:DUF5615 family PIN-like protein [Zavarzinella sp.]